jgi:hypothetical protein
MRVIGPSLFVMLSLLNQEAAQACSIDYELNERELAKNVFILVDKSPAVQRLCLFRAGEFVSEYPVSTGRERVEGARFSRSYDSLTPYCSSTPTGMNLTVGEMNPHRESRQWTGRSENAPVMYNALELRGTDFRGPTDHWSRHLYSRSERES